MSSDGQAKMGQALELLREALWPFVERQVLRRRPPRWRLIDFVKLNDSLRDRHFRDWDVAALLKFMQYLWNDVFRHVLGRTDRAFITEWQDWRNKWAHQERLPAEDIDRALDSAARLLRAIDARSQAAQVAQLRDRVAEPRRTPNPSSNPRPNTPHGSQADAIRHYAMANHVTPWRESGGDLLTIRAGDIQREMGLRNATPNVCSALEGAKFLALANVALVRRDGPRRSTTTTYHYRRKMSAKAVSGGLWCLTV